MKKTENFVLNDMESDCWVVDSLRKYLEDGLDASRVYNALLANIKKDREWIDVLYEVGTIQYCQLLHEYGVSLEEIENLLVVLSELDWSIVGDWLGYEYEGWRELGIDVDKYIINYIDGVKHIDLDIVLDEIVYGYAYVVEESGYHYQIPNDYTSLGNGKAIVRKCFPEHLKKPAVERLMNKYPIVDIISATNDDFEFLSALINEVGISPTKIAEKYKREVKYEDVRWEDCWIMIELLENNSGVLEIEEIIKAVSHIAKTNYNFFDPDQEEEVEMETDDFFNRLKALGADPEVLISYGIKPMEED